MIEQLADYVKKAREAGIGDGEIRQNLLQAGWQAKDIEEALALHVTPLAQISESQPAKPQIQPDAAGLEFKNVRTLLREAWSIYKKRFWTLLGIVILPFIFFIIPIALGSVNNIMLNIIVLLLFLFGIFAYLWSQVAVINAVKDTDENIGISEAYKRSWAKVWAYVWISFVTGFIVFGGFMLLVVPGIIFALWFGLSGFVLVTEGDRGMNALMKSKEYVKGRAGGVFWRLFAMGFIVGLAVIIINKILELVIHNVNFASSVSSFITLLVAPFYIAYTFALYDNLRKLRGEFVFDAKGKGKFIILGWLGNVGVVLILIFVLFTVALNNARKKSEDARLNVEFTKIMIGLDLYHTEKQSYPRTIEELLPAKYLNNIPMSDLGAYFDYSVKDSGESFELCKKWTLVDLAQDKCTGPKPAQDLVTPGVD